MSAVAAVPARSQASLGVAEGSHRFAVQATAVSIAFMPFLRPGAGGLVTPADLAIAGAVLATALWLGTYGLLVRLPFVVPVALMVGAGALAGALGDFPAAAGVALFQDLVLFVWCAMIANVCRTPTALASVLRAWGLSATVCGALLIVAVLSGSMSFAGQEVEGGRAALTFVTPNQAGSYFAVSLLVLLASGFPRRRTSRIVAASIVFVAILLTGSNAALGGLMAALAVSWVLRVARRGGATAAIAAGVLVLAVAGTLALLVVRLDLIDSARQSDNTFARITIGRSERSANDRVARVSQLRDLYLEGGPLGLGPAATKYALAEGSSATAKSAHNDYAATLVERGLVGAIGLASLIGSLALMAARIGVRPLRPAFAAVLRSTGPLVGALVAVALSGLSHEVLHFRQIWALFGVIAALALWGRPDERATTGAAP